MQSRLLWIAVITALSTPTLHAGSVDYNTSNTPACTAAQVARVNHVTQRQLGIDVKDPDGHYIGSSEADGFGYRNWEPIDTYKHSLCGVLDHYDFYNPWGDEDDANKYVIPNSGFEGILFNPVAWGYTTRGDLHTCANSSGSSPCMEAEITPPDPYPDSNPWFPHSEGVGSSLAGKTLCTYGPWVADHGHSGRPEIHPSEAIWWEVANNPRTGLQEHRVHLMQDDSDRYGARSDFEPDMPSSIKPWSGTPRTAYVRKAFVVPPGRSAPIYLHVYEGSTYMVTTPENAWLKSDATVGTQHTLTYNGVEKITVVEHQPDDNLGVVFDEFPASPIPLPPWIEPEILHDVCKRSDGNLQGFVTLRTQFGKMEGLGSFSFPISGFQDLIIRHTVGLSDVIGPLESSSSKHSTDPATFSVKEAKLDPTSLKVKRVDSRVLVHGDLVVEPMSGATITEATLIDSTGAKTTLSVDSKAGKGNLVRLHAVDLSTEQSLHIRFADGKTITNVLPGLALTADLVVAQELTDAMLQDDQQLDSAWKELVRYVGGANVARPSSFAHAARWTATALPVFAARKEGKPSWEDSFEVAKLLNAAAVKDNAGALSMDMAAKSLTWTSGATGKGKPEYGHKHWVHEVDFGDATLLRSDDVTLQITDVFGGEVTKAQRVWSHVLRDDADVLVAKLPDLIADLAAVERLTVSARRRPASRPSDDASYSDVALRKRALQKLYQRSSRDGFVTPDELAILVKLARRVGADQVAARDSVSPKLGE